jgi:TM2 domain-containing membrane protein YozV
MRALVAGTILAAAFCSLATGEEAESTAVLNPQVAQYDHEAIPHDPLASAIFSATLPGTGQLYNKEYLRGALTAVLFYGGFFTAQYMMLRWERLNTDTFYIAEVTPTGGEITPPIIHMAPHPSARKSRWGCPLKRR